MKGFEKKENNKLSLLTESKYSQKIYEVHSEELTPKLKTYYDSLDIKQLINSPMNLKRILANAVEELIQGVFIGFDGNKWSPLLMVEAEGRVIAAIMYDRHNNTFVEGLTSASMVYEPVDHKTEEILRRFKYK
jgi:hypothetical protein